MISDSIYRLPAYPSTSARKSFSPSQLASLNQAISASLLQAAALPPSKQDTPAARAFVASYAKDTAFQVLQGLIWAKPSPPNDERLIKKRTMVLAEKLASLAPGLEIQTLLDLAIIYAPTNVSRVKAISEASLKSNSGQVLTTIESELVPAFTHLLDPSQGLYAIRKASHCIKSFLYSSPLEIVRCFAQNQPFVLTLATLYDQGLASIAHSYGGLSALRNQNSSVVDEWEPIWVQSKVDLVDTFHVIISTLLNDISTTSGRSLAIESERTFNIIFALLEIPATSSSNSTSSTHTPFLDRSLLADYQESYTLSKTLTSALHNAAEKDARLDLLQSALQSLESSPSDPLDTKAGILKILIGSSGIAPGIDNRGNGGRVRSTAPGNPTTSNHKGKERTPPKPSSAPDIDIKVTQVLDILPEHPQEYIRALLEYPSYGGNPEKVVEALLEGTAPSAEQLELPVTWGDNVGDYTKDVSTYIRERRNVFDDEVMDTTQLRFGKKSDDASAVLRDRTFVNQMKADILRRAEAISDDEEEEYFLESEYTQGRVPKGRGVVVAFDDEDELGGARVVKIGGDGEESDESDGDEREDGEEEVPSKLQSLETILELAYIRDPKLFDRDAQTRRSKTRSDLKAQTGWSDEQIEGWRIMLERNPRKDKVLQKHEFSGNQAPIAQSSAGPSGNDRGRGGRGRGGRGGGGGRGRGGGRGGGGGGDDARERAWKDKNKASRGNHNRKRGHDKKMAHAGAGIPS